MIDWLSIGLYQEPIRGRRLACNQCLVLSPDGEVQSHRDLSVEVEGSWSEKVKVHQAGALDDSHTDFWMRAKGLCGPKLWISGNPSKWFQHHNLFGSDDVEGLARALSADVLGRLGWSLTELEERAVAVGLVKLSRVDCTAMLDCGSEEAVRSVLRHVEIYGRTAQRGRPTVKKKTVGWGYGGRRSQLKLYGKLEELKGHPLDDHFSHEDQVLLLGWAAGALRVELQLRQKVLEERGMCHVGVWTEEQALGMLTWALGGVEMPQNVELGELAVEGLPRPLMLTYKLWVNCHDPRGVMSQATWYRHRKRLMGFGIDIAEAPAGKAFVEPDYSNVVALRPEPVKSFWELYGDRLKDVPDWAKGTPLYYEPRVVG